MRLLPEPCTNAVPRYGGQLRSGLGLTVSELLAEPMLKRAAVVEEFAAEA